MAEVVEKKKRDEKTIKRQIHTNAWKYLLELANKEQQRTGIYAAPTKEAHIAECKKRWQEHLDRKKGPVDISEYFA